jgi:hypothetical protein
MRESYIHEGEQLLDSRTLKPLQAFAAELPKLPGSTMPFLEIRSCSETPGISLWNVHRFRDKLSDGGRWLNNRAFSLSTMTALWPTQSPRFCAAPGSESKRFTMVFPQSTTQSNRSRT